MDAERRARLIATARGTSTPKIGVTGVTHASSRFGCTLPPRLSHLRVLKKAEQNQCVTPDTPCHTVETGDEEKRHTASGVAEAFPERVTAAYGGALARLSARCPAIVPVDRWQQAVADAGAFLATWGAQAEQFGWAPEDLFGLHPTAPLARVDMMGLLWILQGGRVIALTTNAAVLSGGFRLYRRPTNRINCACGAGH